MRFPRPVRAVLPLLEPLLGQTSSTARVAAVWALVLLNAGCSTQEREPSIRQPTVRSTGGISPQAESVPDGKADDGQWVRPAKDYASTRFSQLAEITTHNAKNFATGVDIFHRRAARA